MPFAVDDAHRDIALALLQRIAGAEMSAHRPHHLRQLGVVHPDLVWPAERTAGLDQRAITLLLLRRHLVIGNFDIAAKGRRIGHFRVLPVDWRTILQRQRGPVDRERRPPTVMLMPCAAFKSRWPGESVLLGLSVYPAGNGRRPGDFA